MFQFNVEAAPQAKANDNQDRKQVDWEARTKYLTEKCGTQDKPETEIFIISGVIDLGLHAQEDAKMEWKGDAESEAAELVKNPDQYFETLDNDKGVPTRYKRWKAKPQQMCAITVDNPNRLLDHGQWFGEDTGENPLRMLLNNEFYQKGVGKVVGKAYSLKETRQDDGSWSLKNNTILYKLAAATEVLGPRKEFKPSQLGQLLGKPVLCEFQVFSKAYEGKEYLNEKVSFKGAVPSIMKPMIPTLDSKYIYGVNFKGPQNPEVLKQLRQSVINTMTQALNFEGSDIQKALIELGRVKPSEGSANNVHEAPKAQSPSPKQESKAEVSPTPQGVPVDDFSDDLPFAPIGLQEGRLFLHMI